MLRNLSFSVKEATIHGIVGGNGSGKSTLLKALAQMHKFNRGKQFSKFKEVAYLPQNPQTLFVYETVKEEIGEWAKSSEAAYEMLRLIGLADKETFHPYDLSGGQQQLLAIAKMMVALPKILLLDEPTKGLDPKSKNIISQLLYNAQLSGVTTVIASHDLAFLRTVSDQISMLFDGEIAQTCSSNEFFEQNIYYTSAI